MSHHQTPRQWGRSWRGFPCCAQQMLRAGVSSVTNATLPRRSHSFLHHSTHLVYVIVILLFRRRTVLRAAEFFMIPHTFVVHVWLLTMWTFVLLHSRVEIFVVLQAFLRWKFLVTHWTLVNFLFLFSCLLLVIIVVFTRLGAFVPAGDKLRFFPLILNYCMLFLW